MEFSGKSVVVTGGAKESLCLASEMASDGTAGAKLDKSVPLFVQNEREVGVMKNTGFR